MWRKNNVQSEEYLELEVLDVSESGEFQTPQGDTKSLETKYAYLQLECETLKEELASFVSEELVRQKELDTLYSVITNLAGHVGGWAMSSRRADADRHRNAALELSVKWANHAVTRKQRKRPCRKGV